MNAYTRSLLALKQTSKNMNFNNKYASNEQLNKQAFYSGRAKEKKKRKWLKYVVIGGLLIIAGVAAWFYLNKDDDDAGFEQSDIFSNMRRGQNPDFGDMDPEEMREKIESGELEPPEGGMGPGGGGPMSMDLPDTYEEFLESDEEGLEQFQDVVGSEEDYELLKEMFEAMQDQDFDRVEEISEELGLNFNRPNNNSETN